MAEKLEQFRDPLLDVSGDVIGFYPREFYPFDNFAAFQVAWRDRRWPTSEHAYQAARYFDTAPDVSDEIAAAPSPHDAYAISAANKHRGAADWADLKIGIMGDICLHKLVQHPYVQRKLLQTGDLVIVEDSPKDDFWGWGKDRNGRNELGKIWMRLREELRAGSIPLEVED